MSNKTSDKNVANIEEDIKLVKRYLENSAYKESNSDFFRNGGWEIVDLEVPQAIEHILAELEQKDKRIQELEEERQLVGIPVRNKRDGNIGIVLHQWENGSIAVLERINPRIINTHDSWNTLEIITDEVKQIQTQDNSIPTQKVIDKIKELKLSGGSDGKDNVENLVRELAIDILQELLGGEK